MVSRDLSAKAQAVAKEVLAELGPTIAAEDTEETLVERATRLLRNKRVSATWYHNCPALVLLGSRSCLSLSGRDYQPSTEPVGQTNVVTVDLSPLLDGAWGDCARTYFVECGRHAAQPQSPEFLRGQRMELALHRALKQSASPEMTFHDLHRFASDRIVSGGFENLDFRGNLGHTIEQQLEHRCYVEPGNRLRLSEVDLFTFEPHIREVGSRWGFKHENIYFVSTNGEVVEL